MLKGLVGEDIKVTTVLAPGLGHTRTDRGQIEQVLLNLAMNARDAMPGSGRLTIETANMDPDAEYVRQNPDVAPGPYIMFAVTDTGSGMTDAVKKHLFEPFFTTKAAGKGTGMGLAASFGIVNQSGGHISVRSDPGHGTTVRVYLPRVETPLVVKHEPAADESPRGTETILLAEDEPVLRDLARMILGDLGYKVLEAEDGEAALELVQKKKRPALDLLLSDIMMPRMGGMQLAAKLRADYPQIKVLFISGYSTEVIARQGAFEPGTMFLAKPFTPSVLACKVRETLDS
jgi:CheY-like chemotaxis protein